MNQVVRSWSLMKKDMNPSMAKRRNKSGVIRK